MATQQLAVRGSQGLFMMSGSPRFGAGEEGSGFSREPSSNCRVMAFSPDGDRFAWSDGKAVHLAAWTPAGTWKTTVTLEASGRTASMRFSPKGTVLATWEVFAKGNNQLENNVRLWSTDSGSQIHAYVHRKSEGWSPQWTSDEAVCCTKSANGEVVFFQNNEFGQGPLPSRLSIKALDTHYMSPTAAGADGGARVACYVPGQKGGPGFCKIFVYPKFNAETDSVATKSFMNADRMEAKWAKSDGKSCLILAQAEVDKSGASYYGKTQLCYANTDGDTCLVQLPKEGPIYSVEWSPVKPVQFVVVYGYMPARATLFNRKCESVFDFGTGPRNMVLFNPMGNLLLLGGFGNLRGNVEMWDVPGKKKAAQFEAPDTTDVKWSPDGQHIVTSTCAPRLRTGNGFKVWHYTSTLFHETVLVNNKANHTPNEKQIAAPTVDELWEVQWRPAPEGTHPPSFHVMTRPLAGGVESKTPTASKQAYRPPGARNRPADAPAGEAKNGVYKASRTPVGVAPPAGAPPPPGSGNDDAASKSAMKNKKRKEATKKKKEAEAAAANSAAAGATAAAPTAAAAANDDRDKQVKKLEKKLQDIEKLKARKAKGETLEVNQLEKISKESELIDEMKKLKT